MKIKTRTKNTMVVFLMLTTTASAIVGILAATLSIFPVDSKSTIMASCFSVAVGLACVLGLFLHFTSSALTHNEKRDIFIGCIKDRINNLGLDALNIQREAVKIIRDNLSDGGALANMNKEIVGQVSEKILDAVEKDNGLKSIRDGIIVGSSNAISSVSVDADTIMEKAARNISESVLSRKTDTASYIG